MNPAQVALDCRERILKKAAALTDNLLDHAKTNAQAAKFLFEFAGLTQPTAPVSDAPHPGEQLIAELKRVLDESGPAPPVE